MPATLVNPKTYRVKIRRSFPVQTSCSGDLSLCICRESWATLVFGRLNREPISLHLAMELAELAEKDAAELRQLAAALVYELKS